MKSEAYFSYMPTISLPRDAIAFSVGTVTGAAMIAIPYHTPWLEFAGVCFVSYSFFSFVFKVCSALICRRCDNLQNHIYNTIRLYKSWAFLSSAITVVAYAEVESHVKAQHKLAFMILAAAIIAVLKNMTMMHLTNRFVWEMYAARIKTSIMIQACFRAIYNHVKGRPCADVPFDGKTTIHSIHRILQSSQWTDDFTADDIWNKLIGGTYVDDPQPIRIDVVPSPPATAYRSPLRRVFKSPRPSVNNSPIKVVHDIYLHTLADIVKYPLAKSLRAALGMENCVEDQIVDKHTFLRAITKASASRVALKSTIDDYISIVSKLSAALTMVAVIILLIVCCIIAGVNLMTTGTTWLTFILAFSFCFGDTAKKMFEGIILVFVWQSYAVSDRILMYDDSGEVQNLCVTKINLLTTEFLRGDGIIYTMSNSTIQSRDIRNVSRATYNCTTLQVKLTDTMASHVLDDLYKVLEDYRLEKFDKKISSVQVQMRTVKDNGITSDAVVCLLHTQNFEDSDERYFIHDCFARKAHDFFVSINTEKPQLILATNS